MFPKSVANIKKRNAISSEVAWRVCKLSGRSTPGNLLAKRPTSRNQGGICRGASCSRSLSARRISRIQSRSKRCFAILRGPISLTRASAFPQNDSRYGASAPESKSSIASWNSKIWPISSQDWSLYVRRPGNRRTRSIGLLVLISRRHRQPPAALSTASLILFSLDVITHA